MANHLARFDPFSGIGRFDPFRALDDFFVDVPLLPERFDTQVGQRIRLDIAEDDKNYLVKADIPGVKKEDIRIAIDGNQVSVTAQTKEEKESSGAGMLRSERYCGQQYRYFTLPTEVDSDQAQARFEDGVLQLTLPKKPGHGARQLTIQ